MRRTTADGAAACLPGCWADDGRCGPAGPGPVPGPAAGGRDGGALRSVPHFAGAGAGAAAGPGAGFAVLAGGHRRAVCLVPKRLGRTGPAVRCGLLHGGRSPIFLGGQPLAAAPGIPGSRSDGRSFGHFDLSAGGRGGNSKKNQKNCKKHLPFPDEMV